MNEKKFTKGPWKVYSHDVDLCSVEQDNDDPLQVCGLIHGESCATENHISSEQRKANANLISAAPELLEEYEHTLMLVARIHSELRIGNISGAMRMTGKLVAIESPAISKAYGETE